MSRVLLSLWTVRFAESLSGFGTHVAIGASGPRPKKLCHRNDETLGWDRCDVGELNYRIK